MDLQRWNNIFLHPFPVALRSKLYKDYIFTENLNAALEGKGQDKIDKVGGIFLNLFSLSV